MTPLPRKLATFTMGCAIGIVLGTIGLMFVDPPIPLPAALLLFACALFCGFGGAMQWRCEK